MNSLCKAFHKRNYAQLNIMPSETPIKSAQAASSVSSVLFAKSVHECFLRSILHGTQVATKDQQAHHDGDADTEHAPLPGCVGRLEGLLYIFFTVMLS